MNAGRIHRCALFILLGLYLQAAAQDSLPASESGLTSPTKPSGPSSRPVAKSSPRSTEDIEDLNLLNLQVPEVPMVVTAGRREEKASSIPNALSVITADDIRQAGARTVTDALRLAPGVDVADLSFNNAAVSIRGLHGLLSREILVLVDGRQVFDTFFGGTLWGNWPFQLEDIQRIEVIRGPAGVTWGANATNGVINIITKDPKDQQGLTSAGGGGSRGTWKEHEGYGFTDGKLSMRVSGEYEASDGFPGGYSIFPGHDDDLKTGRSNVFATYDAGPKDKVTVSGGNALVDGGFSASPMAALLSGTRHPGSQASFLMGKWDHKVSQDESFGLTGYVNDFQLSPGLKVMDYRYQQFALQFSHIFKPAQDHTFTWGVDSRTDLLDSSNSDPFLETEGFLSTAIIGLYAQDEWRFAPKWTLTLGSRIDYEFYGGFQPSARASLAYDLSKTSSIYGSVSRAFEMAPLGSRAFCLPVAAPVGYATSQKDGNPVTLIAYELGYRSTFLDKALQTNAALFCHSYNDLIVFHPEPGPPGLINYEMRNGYDAYIYGLELDAKYAVTRKLTLLANYTFQQMDSRGASSLRDYDTMSPPKHKFMVGPRYSPTKDLTLSSSLYFVDNVSGPNLLDLLPRRSIPSYFRLDMRAEQRFWNDRASIAVGVSNLLDNVHPEGTSMFVNPTEVPRMVYAEFRLVLK